MVTKAPDSVELRDPRVEAWLERHELSWEFHDGLALSRIDRKASLTNQARLEAIDAEVVDRYAADMERGDRFPPIVLWRRGKTLVVIGGNHRVAAARKAKRPALAAYVVDCDDQKALVLTYEDNRYHGLPPSEHERLLQAVHLVESKQADPFEAAAIVGVPGHKLSRKLSVIKSDRRAKKMKVAGWEALSEAARHRLGHIESDTVFTAAADMAAATNLGYQGATELATRVNAAPTEEEALVIVGTEREFRESHIRVHEAPHRGRKDQRIRALDAIADLVALSPAKIVDECESNDHRQYLETRCLAAAAILRRTLAALRRPS